MEGRELRPVRHQLLAPLTEVYRSVNRPTERALATDILADYAAGNPQLLADLLMDADDTQFAVLFPKLEEQGERGLPILASELTRKLLPQGHSDSTVRFDEMKDKLAKRQANAAVALLRLNHSARVWRFLQDSPDPRVRSYLIERVGLLALADYAADQPSILADLLMDADDNQFAILLPKIKDPGKKGLAVLTGEIDKTLPPDAKENAREQLAKRQANAAVALLRMNQPEKVWPLLRHSPDPRARSYLLHRLSPLGVDANAIVRQLDRESDLTIRRALLLGLGEFGEKITSEDREALLPKLRDIYRTAPDAGLHAASEWLLRQWQQDLTWSEDKQKQLTKLKEIEPRSGEGHEQGRGPLVRQWPGSDDGGHSRSRRVLDGFSANGGRPRGRSRGDDGVTTLAAHRPLVRHRLQESHGGTVPPLPQGLSNSGAVCTLERLPGQQRDVVRCGGVLQLAE